MFLEPSLLFYYLAWDVTFVQLGLCRPLDLCYTFIPFCR